MSLLNLTYKGVMMELYMALFIIIIHWIHVLINAQIEFFRVIIVKVKLYFKRIKVTFLNRINY